MALLHLVQGKVKDDSGRLTDIGDYDPAIDAALERYSIHRPRVLVMDLTGEGDHDVILPVEWREEFSRMLRVEYPVGEVPEQYVDGDLWRIYQGPEGWVLRLLEDEPTDQEYVRVTFTAPRLEGDIVPGDTDAVACLAASFCLDTLASLYLATNDPTIMADVVNYRSKGDEAARRAKALRKLYLDHMGIDENGGAPAAMTVAPPPAGGMGLTHWRR